jgi:hypothetical protein
MQHGMQRRAAGKLGQHEVAGCPHSTIGRNHGDFSPGQSFGKNRTVSAASARKCANRNTSRSVLSIGYIHCSRMRGSQWFICGTYQVSVT